MGQKLWYGTCWYATTTHQNQDIIFRFFIFILSYHAYFYITQKTRNINTKLLELSAKNVWPKKEYSVFGFL